MTARGCSSPEAQRCRAPAGLVAAGPADAGARQSHPESPCPPSRSGGSYTLSAALPARYRFHKDALELQLAGLMPQEQLNMHLQALISVVEGEPAACHWPMPNASPPTGWADSAFSGMASSHATAARMRADSPIRADDRSSIAAGQSAGGASGLDSLPWPALPRWQAAALPEDEDELQRLDALR
jgi:hypothetical protein